MFKSKFKRFEGEYIPDIIEYLRDYIEVLSPDTEEAYSKCLRAPSIKTTVIKAK